MNHAPQEGAGGEHDRRAGDRAAVRELGPRHGAGAGGDPSGFPFNDCQVRGVTEEPLHCEPIELPVGLRAGALDGRPFAAIEDAELDAGRIGRTRHHTIQRIDLTNQMAFA